MPPGGQELRPTTAGKPSIRYDDFPSVTSIYEDVPYVL